MEQDFPAAHSMDTTWYAIDAAGFVAQFSTGENGHAPECLGNHQLSLYDWQRRQPNANEDDWQTDHGFAATFGVFHYDYDEASDPIAPFYRVYVPEQPLHIDTMPPDFRKSWRTVQFPTLNFADALLVQPLDFMRCVYWYDDRNGFITGDGVTVRPCVGREEQFAAFLDELQREQPETFAKYTFLAEALKYDKPGGRV